MKSGSYIALSELALVLMGQSPPSSTCSETDEGIPFIQGNAEFGTRHPVPRLKCSAPTRLAKAGDILLSVRAPVGEVNQASEETVIGRGLCATRFDEESRDFAWHAVKFATPALNQVAQGSTFVAISREDVERLVIPWHGKSNARIARILDTADALIAKSEAVLLKLRHVRTGLLNDLLTRGLDANGHLRDPVAHPEQFKDSPLGRIPREWEVSSLESQTESSAYGPRFPGECYSAEGNVALLRTTDMDQSGNLMLDQMPRAELQEKEFEGHFLRQGDFLISRSGTCGIGAVFEGFRIPVLPGAFLIRFRLRESLSPQYLRQYANSAIGAPRIRDLAEGGVQKNIRGSALSQHIIPVPPRPEQDQIIRLLSNHDRMIAAEESELAKLRQLKSGLMTDLLEGRVRVDTLPS